MDIKEYKQSAKLIRDNEIYKVYDLSDLNHLTVSLTELEPQKATTGHSHVDADEVYVFIDGEGLMEAASRKIQVKTGDMVLVPAGDFHKVYNQGEKNLSFWTIFEKYEGRGK
ncbi:MAG: cupin [Candidatus Wolfebacteria bacterium GW2011_GWA2_42_10]|uniref:Cupin n=2 Tax=Candidatus Wolfeibacteriota TaxID=1752735 RepID=A0A0G0XLG3_9BACT|nr:MAG: cupin [Candidatus Wolfebacteria bacterium GW2011_GWB1_41_12]KKS25297.1 MAG: cupin [Candidatus Wolfebacteria bacterium GW2011_GWA2_42_10]KKT56736.1 MAG: cupin [Candidatus Wolfebacteria bacterium GW2011_GWA1_44_24]